MNNNKITRMRQSFDLRTLAVWATQGEPGSVDANQRLYHTLLYHMQRSSQAIRGLQKDRDRLLSANRELRVEKKKLDDKPLEKDGACRTLEKEVETEKNSVLNHATSNRNLKAKRAELLEEFRKVRERQNLAPSYDDLVSKVSNLEGEPPNVRERLKISDLSKQGVTKINGKLKGDLEEGQERETIINKQS